MTTKTATNSFGILRNRKSSTVGLPYPRSLQPLVHAVRVRGDDSVDETIAELVSTEFLSKENLTSFIAVHGLLMGAGFEFASNLMMKLMHNYHDKDTQANQASRLAGAQMCAFGLISYLSVVKNFSPTKAMGWMEPCTTCSTYICERYFGELEIKILPESSCYCVFDYCNLRCLSYY